MLLGSEDDEVFDRLGTVTRDRIVIEVERGTSDGAVDRLVYDRQGTLLRTMRATDNRWPPARLQEREAGRFVGVFATDEGVPSTVDGVDLPDQSGLVAVWFDDELRFEKARTLVRWPDNAPMSPMQTALLPHPLGGEYIVLPSEGGGPIPRGIELRVLPDSVHEAVVPALEAGQQNAALVFWMPPE